MSQHRYIRALLRAEGNIFEVTSTAWPIVVGMLSYTAMGVADTLMVGWLGTTEIAAVGLATTVFYLFNAFFLGLLHAVKIVVSQATGAGRHQRAVVAAWHGIALGVLCGVAAATTTLAGPWMFALMGGSEAVQAGAQSYFGVRVLGAPVWYVFIAMSQYYQGTGDTKTPMRLTLLANVLNIALDALLIFGLGPAPALGMVGAAWATVAASAVSMMVLGAMFLRDVSHTPVFERGLWRELLGLGLPVGGRYVLDVGGFAVFTALIARMGEDALAANQIAIKIVSMSFLPGHGIGEAVSILAGQYYGAGKLDAVRRACTSGLALGVAVMGAMGAVFCAMPETLIRAFQSDPAVVAIGVQLLYVAVVFQVFDALAMIVSGALNGLGDTRFTLVAAIFATWVLMVPTSYAFGVWLDWGAPGAWMGFLVELVFLSAVGSWRFYGGSWRRDEV